MEARTGFAPVDGTSLYYEVTGEGPAVALLHGRGADHRMWADQVPVLAARYRVVNYDMRGFGRSAPGENRYSHADDLAELLDHLGVPTVVPIGLSLGGGAAVNFAVLHPGRLHGLLAVDSSLGGHAWSAEFAGIMERMQRTAVESGVEAAKQLMLESPMLNRLESRPEAGRLMRAIFKAYSGIQWTRPDLGRPLVPPAIERLGSIVAPTLVIVGEHDMADFHAIADVLATRIPRARKVVMKGLGHVPSMEDPAAFNRLLLEFLDSLEPA